MIEETRSGTRRSFSHVALVGAIATLALGVVASPAGAALTLGQLAPSNPANGDCANPAPFDVLQPTVTSGNTYVVPATGRITSWSHNASGDPGQSIAFKAYRPLGGQTYQVIGADGPRDITSSALNTFSALNIPVKSGDVIGLNDGPPSGCAFSVPGETGFGERNGNLGVGESDIFSFGSRPDVRVNLTAVFVPDNTFTMGALSRNKKKGTATLAVNVPNPGDLTGSGPGAKVAGGATSSKAVGPGTATLLIKAKGKKKRKLNKTGKVKLTISIRYTPTGGDGTTQQRKVKLRKKV